MKKWPALRFGSLAAALEEYAEAALFMKWLEAKKDPSGAARRVAAGAGPTFDR